MSDILNILIPELETEFRIFKSYINFIRTFFPSVLIRSFYDQFFSFCLNSGRSILRPVPVHLFFVCIETRNSFPHRVQCFALFVNFETSPIPCVEQRHFFLVSRSNEPKNFRSPKLSNKKPPNQNRGNEITKEIQNFSRVSGFLDYKLHRHDRQPF